MKRFHLVKLITADALFSQTDRLDAARESAVRYLADSNAEGVFYLIDSDAALVELVASRRSEVKVAK